MPCDVLSRHTVRTIQFRSPVAVRSGRACLRGETHIRTEHTDRSCFTEREVSELLMTLLPAGGHQAGVRRIRCISRNITERLATRPFPHRARQNRARPGSGFVYRERKRIRVS
jgi:hypothetical protein